MNATQPQTPTILLDRHAHNYAQQFASEQTSVAKGRQVYLNTLAVCGVKTYLQCLNINSDLAHSDCWQASLRNLFNVADLTLPNLGKIECLYLLPNETQVQIPLEAREDRLGYLIVRLEAQLQQLELLGFMSGDRITLETESIALTQLQPLDFLFETTARLQNKVSSKVNLSQWFNELIAPDWQPVTTVLAGRITRSLAKSDPAVTTVTRGKVIQWQLNSLEPEIILVLKVCQQSDRTIDLCLQLYPGNAGDNLPSGLSVAIFDRDNQSCLSAQAKDSDDWMQLEFGCQPGEQFRVEMGLNGVSAIEKFVA